MTRPEFIYRHRWQVGDVVIWDNCSAIHQALRSPETVARIAKQGAEPGNLTLEQLAQFMRGETVKWSKAVKASGAKVE